MDVILEHTLKKGLGYPRMAAKAAQSTWLDPRRIRLGQGMGHAIQWKRRPNLHLYVQATWLFRVITIR